MERPKRILSLLGIGFSIACGALALFLIFVPVAPFSQDQKLFYVHAGVGSKTIAANLKEQGLIRSALAFLLFAFATGTTHALQAGPYQIGPGSSAASITKKLETGDIATLSLTII